LSKRHCTDEKNNERKVFFEHLKSIDYQNYNGNAKILFLCQLDLFICLKMKLFCLHFDYFRMLFETLNQKEIFKIQFLWIVQSSFGFKKPKKRTNFIENKKA
jgi:hypothetical protein